jgi:hypothetical protein
LKHVKGCPCKSCWGRRANTIGRPSQGKAARHLGLVPEGRRARHHEEDQGGGVRFENKTGSAAKPVITAFRKVAVQSEGSRSFGDHRPFVGTFDHDGCHVGVFELATILDVAVAVLIGHGYKVEAPREAGM